MTDAHTPELYRIDAATMEEALRRLQLLATGVHERSALHLREITSSAAWVMGSPDRAAAVLRIAAHGFAMADENDAAWAFAALRRQLVEG